MTMAAPPPRISHVSRQPTSSIRSWLRGEKMKMPIGMPMKATDIALPRLRMNQLESGTDMNRLPPPPWMPVAPTTKKTMTICQPSWTFASANIAPPASKAGEGEEQTRAVLVDQAADEPAGGREADDPRRLRPTEDGGADVRARRASA